jgi:hypothetical protein
MARPWLTMTTAGMQWTELCRRWPHGMILAWKNGRVTRGRWRRDRSTEREPRVRRGKASHDSIRHRGVDVEHGLEQPGWRRALSVLEVSVEGWRCLVARGRAQNGC